MKEVLKTYLKFVKGRKEKFPDINAYGLCIFLLRLPERDTLIR